MKGLNGGRVLLLDDQPNEAYPIIKALSKIGVPTIYFDGSPGDFPKQTQRLRGVRLAILDINLDVSGSEKNMASTLVQTLTRIIQPDNGPYGILLWTLHPDVKDLVCEYLFGQSQLPNPVFVEMLKKSDFITADPGASTKNFRINKLRSALTKALSESSPLECLQVWEGSCFEAATRVTNGIAELPTSQATKLADWRMDWRNETLKLLYTISRAKAERLHTAENCIPSMFLAINPLHVDRMDTLAESVSENLAGYATQIMAAQGGTATDRKAKVNTMLHLASDHLDRFAPGNLYILRKKGNPPFISKLQDLLLNTYQPDTNENQKLVQGSARPFALEITPVCDYAQNKMGLSRLALGFMLPSVHENRVKRADFIKRAGPFFFSNEQLPAGPYTLHFNSRHVASAKLSDAEKLKAKARVRPPMLSDIQSWLAYQGSRQGVIMLA